MDQGLSIACVNCGTELRPQDFPSGVKVRCPRCPEAMQAELFPEFYRKRAPAQTGQLITLEGEASCFYHAQKRAVVACEGCGRFLCALCEVEFAGRRLCPACIEAGKSKKKIANLETQRILYDDIALSLAVLPILTFWGTFIGAPAALYYAIRYWNAPLSFIPRTRIRFVLAIIIALAQIAGWCIGGYFIFKSWSRS